MKVSSPSKDKNGYRPLATVERVVTIFCLKISNLRVPVYRVTNAAHRSALPGDHDKYPDPTLLLQRNPV
jgi:hypothetical protein